MFKHWRVEQLQNLKSAAEQARERLVNHVEKVGNVAKRMKYAPGPATGDRLVQLRAVALAERVPLELHESAFDDAVVRPRHRRAARCSASVRSNGARELELPRQAGLGATVRRSQLQPGRALQVAVDGGDEALRRAPPRRPGPSQCSWYGSGAWIDDPCAVRPVVSASAPSPLTPSMVNVRSHGHHSR